MVLKTFILNLELCVGFYHVKLSSQKMTVWKMYILEINIGMCGIDLILGCYFLKLCQLNQIKDK
jgi:hypothetical protein